MRKLLIFLLCFTCNFYVFGQFDDQMSLPPSPNASSILKYGNTPVNQYTGVAGISAPLYEIKARGLTIPVALSYHASGIKVQDVASSVGLGWSLNVNCIVSRNVRGLPDESENGYFGANMAERITQPLDRATMTAISLGNLDSEPDIFYYNVNGNYGKFVFDKNKKPVFYSNDGIRLLNSPFKKELGIDGWILVDMQGNTFYFGQDVSTRENIISNVHGKNEVKTMEFASSWYLNKIITANALETITYNYTTGANVTTRYFKTKKTFRNAMKSTYDRGIYFLGIPIREASVDVDIDIVDVAEWDAGIRETVVSPKYLSSITTSEEIVNFNHGGTRLDQENGLKLTDIVVKSFKGQNLLMKFVFNYDYFTQSFGGAGGQPITYVGHRLKLDNIEQVSNLNNRIPLYRFSYINNLPLRDEVGVQSSDHWGYANLNTNFRGFPTKISEYDEWRKPDSLAMQAGMLTKIIYKSGASKEFYFEPNQYDRGDGQSEIAGGLRISKIIDVPGIGAAPIVTKYRYTINDRTSSGMLMVKKPIYVSYVEHVSSQIPQNFIPYKPFGIPPYLTEVGSMRGDMVLPIPMRTSLINSLISSLPNLLNGSTGSTSWMYTPFIIYSSTALNNLFDLDGSIVGYSEVTVENGDNGRTVNRYTNIEDYPDYYNQIRVNKDFITVGRLRPDVSPFTSSTSYSFARGKLKESLIYDKKSGLIKRIVNLYGFNSVADSVLGLKIAIGKVDIQSGLQPHYDTYYNMGYYHFVSRPLLLTESYEEDYLESFTGGYRLPVVKRKKFEYDPLFPTLLTKTEEKNGDGLDISVDYKYVANRQTVNYGLQSEGIAANTLYQNNSFDVLLEKTVKRGGQILEGKKVGFNNWQGIGKTMTLPHNIYVNNQGIYQNTTTYRKYDNYGNILQLSHTGGLKTNYRWDESGSKQVLEVKDAEDNEIFMENFETISNANILIGTANSGNKYYQGDYQCTFQAPVGKQYKVMYAYLSAGLWNYSEWEDYGGSSMVLNLGDAIDDVIIIPKESYSTFFTYQKEGIKSVTDLNGNSSFYEYDDFFRLKTIRDNHRDILQHYVYNDVSTYVGNVFLSDEKIANLSNSVCLCGGIIYKVPAGKYYSYISKEDANSKVDREIATDGQAYANTVTFCPLPIDKKIINGKCETGRRICISSVEESNTSWVCEFKYKFSDGSVSGKSEVEIHNYPCVID